MGRLALHDVWRDEDDHYGKKGGARPQPRAVEDRPGRQATGKYSIPLTQPTRRKAA